MSVHLQRNTQLAQNISISSNAIERHIYLLFKLELIDQHFYSNYKYYYPVNHQETKIKFGRPKNKHVTDSQRIRLSITQFLITQKDEQSRKRKVALKQINRILEGNEQ